MVYLTTFRDKKLFKYACKITIATNKALIENEIQEQLTRVVIKCPHFPILYGTYQCNYMLDFNDSFKNSKSDDIPIQQDIKLYPKIIQKAMDANKTYDSYDMSNPKKQTIRFSTENKVRTFYKDKEPMQYPSLKNKLFDFLQKNIITPLYKDKEPVQLVNKPSSSNIKSSHK